MKKGVWNFSPRSIYRSLGGADSLERIGAGFLDKTGKKEDFVNSSNHCYSIVYVIEGEGEYLDKQGSRFELKAGSFFQRLPDVPHSNYINSDKPWRECFIDFGKELFNAFSLSRIIRIEYLSGNIGLDLELILSIE